MTGQRSGSSLATHRTALQLQGKIASGQVDSTSFIRDTLPWLTRAKSSASRPPRHFFFFNVTLSVFTILKRMKRQIELTWFAERAHTLWRGGRLVHNYPCIYNLFQKSTSNNIPPYEVPVSNMKSPELGLGLGLRFELLLPG
jgi:hypothetical protein